MIIEIFETFRNFSEGSAQKSFVKTVLSAIVMLIVNFNDTACSKLIYEPFYLSFLH